MRVERIANLESSESLAGNWNTLAQGVPFRSWEWLSCWWRHYRHSGDLFILAVQDGHGVMAGVAPWYRYRTASNSRILRFLGVGDVCSEYLTVMCRPGCEAQVVAALSDVLTQDGGEARPPARLRPPHDQDGWDLLELASVGVHDPVVNDLAQRLADRGCWPHRRRGPNCWRVQLPATWDDYLAMLSKSHRKQVRRLERRALESGRAVLHTAGNEAELAEGLDILFHLHERRQQSLGRTGCFSDPRFAAFHREVASLLLASGKLRLHWLLLDGRPVAAEYHFAGDGVVYAYQSGIEPEALHEEPGHLAAIATLKLAITQGYRAFDFLRGDEPYKAHWRAQPLPTCELRTAANHAAAQLRYRTWAAGQNLIELAQRGKRWLSAGSHEGN